MTAFPSDVIYQSNAARRQELLVDAAIERRAAGAGILPSRGTSVIGHARRRIGWLLLALGNGLLRMDDSAELKPALEP